MSLISDSKAKVAKTLVNMDRLDAIMNGDINTDVAVDNGLVPTIRKLFEQIKVTNPNAVPKATVKSNITNQPSLLKDTLLEDFFTFERTSWRGAKNDVVGGSAQNDSPAIQAAINNAKAKKLNKIDLGTGTSNVGTALTNANGIIYESSKYAPVNNYPPGYGDLLALSQSYEAKMMGMDYSGNAGAGSSNEWLLFQGIDIFPSNSQSGNEKAALLTIVNHRDPSAWSSDISCEIPRDGVGHQIIVNNKVDKTRAYGMHVIMRTEPGVRAFRQNLELEAHNISGLVERRQGTINTGGVIGIVAANGVQTNGISYISSTYTPGYAAGSFENVMFVDATVVDNYLVRMGLATPTATSADDIFSIHKSGVITIGQSGIDPTGAALYIKRTANRLNAAGNQNAVVKLESSGDAQHYSAFIKTGALARSLGLNTATALFELTAQEGLGANYIASFAQDRMCFFDSAKPTGGLNVVQIANGLSPTGNYANGGQLYCLGGTLRFRGSNGTDTLIAGA